MIESDEHLSEDHRVPFESIYLSTGISPLLTPDRTHDMGRGVKYTRLWERKNYNQFMQMNRKGQGY